MKDILQVACLQVAQDGIGPIWENFGCLMKLKFMDAALEVMSAKPQDFGFLRQAYLFSSLGLLITVKIVLRGELIMAAAPGGFLPLPLTTPLPCALSATAVMPSTMLLLMRRFMLRSASVFNLLKSCIGHFLCPILWKGNYEFST